MNDVTEPGRRPRRSHIAPDRGKLRARGTFGLTHRIADSFDGECVRNVTRSVSGATPTRLLRCRCDEVSHWTGHLATDPAKTLCASRAPRGSRRRSAMPSSGTRGCRATLPHVRPRLEAEEARGFLPEPAGVVFVLSLGQPGGKAVFVEVISGDAGDLV